MRIPRTVGFACMTMALGSIEWNQHWGAISTSAETNQLTEGSRAKEMVCMFIPSLGNHPSWFAWAGFEGPARVDILLTGQVWIRGQF